LVRYSNVLYAKQKDCGKKEEIGNFASIDPDRRKQHRNKKRRQCTTVVSPKKIIVSSILRVAVY
jgi:hypothetical protein